MKQINFILVLLTITLLACGCNKEESRVWTWETEMNIVEGTLFYEDSGPETILFPENGTLWIEGSRVKGLTFSVDFESVPAESGRPNHVDIAFVPEESTIRKHKGTLSLSSYDSEGTIDCTTYYSGLDVVPTTRHKAKFSFDMSLAIDKEWSSGSDGSVSGNTFLRAELASGQRILFRIKNLKVITS